ncbi:MAG: hypothetical protein EPO16_11250 [Dehalococcoidia bacterium]|nr:MAG: hypothetical protein EPO16_11250 [Dehalococcoidia bacterium]
MQQSPVTIGLFAGACAGLVFGVSQLVGEGGNVASVLLMPMFGALVGAILGMAFGSLFRRGR